MKKNLHIGVGAFSEKARETIEAEKAAAPDTKVTMKILTTENAPEILNEIFSNDSVCFWSNEK